MTKSNDLPSGQYVRLNQILRMIPVSKSTWYRGIKSGIYPKPVRISTRASAWKMEEIIRCLESLELH